MNREYKYISRNIYYPIIKIDNEFYLVNGFPKIWHLPFGVMRNTFFSFDIKKLNETELLLYSKQYLNADKDYKGLIYLIAGISTLNIGKYDKFEKIIISKTTFFLILTLILLAFGIAMFINKKRGNYHQVKYQEAKLKYTVDILKIKQHRLIFLGMILLTVSAYYGVFVIYIACKHNEFCLKTIIDLLYGFAVAILATFPYLSVQIGNYTLTTRQRKK